MTITTVELLARLRNAPDINHCRILPPDQRVPEVVLPMSVRDEAATLISNLVKENEELANALKRTVRLARAYSHGAGSIFEDAMTDAARLADRTIIALRSNLDKEEGS